MRPSVSFFVFLILFVPALLSAQAGQLNFHHLTVNDGLPQTYINDLIKDSRGFYWITSWGGISRYDGIEMLTNEEIAPGLTYNGDVREILEYRGSIYFSSHGYLIEYNYEANRFFEYEVPGYLESSRSSYSMGQLKGSGDYLFAINDYLLFFNVKTKKISQYIKPTLFKDTARYDVRLYPEFKYHVDNIVYTFNTSDTLVIAKAFLENNFLNFALHKTERRFGNYFYILQKHDKQSIYFYVQDQKQTNSEYWIYDLKKRIISSKLKINYPINSIKEHEGNFYVLTQQKGIQIFDGETAQLVDSIVQNPLKSTTLMSNRISWVKFIEGRMIVFQFDRGLSIADLQNNLFTPYFNTNEAEKHNTKAFVRDIVRDSRGHYWCAVSPYNIVELDKNLRYLGKIELPMLDIAALYIENDVLYFGGGAFHAYDIRTKKMTTIYDYTYEGKKLPLSGTMTECQYFQKSIEKDHEFFVTDLWLLFKVNSKTKSIQLIPWAFKGGYGLYSHRDVKGNFIVVNDMFNVFYIDGNGKILYTFKEKFSVRHVYEQDCNHLWLGTTQGLILFDTDKLEIKKQWKKSNGLADNTIYAIVPDTFQRLWLSSNFGLSTISLKDYSIVNYYDEIGQQSREYNRHAFLINPDYSILFAGINGITRVRPWLTRQNQYKLTAILTEVKSKEYHNPQIKNDFKNPLYLNADDQSVSFRIASSDLLYSRSHKILYKLLNVDMEWRTVTNPAYVRYSFLKPGNYIFLYKSLDPVSGKYSDEKRFYFHIDAHFWETLWFKILGLVSIVFSVVLAVYIVFQRKLKKQRIEYEQQIAISRERERIVSDLHDDVGATLSGLKIYSELAEKYVESDPAQSKKLILKVSQHANEVIRNLSDIVWSLKSIEYESASLKPRILQLGADFLNAANIEFQLSVDDKIDAIAHNPLFRKNLILIVKEALNNIAKYAHATHVVINLTKKPGFLVLEIRDNGTGFDPQTISYGNGLKNIQLRTRQLGGKFTLQSCHNQGTFILIEIPVGDMTMEPI